MLGYKCVSQMGAAGWINAVTAVEDTAISKMHVTLSGAGIKIYGNMYEDASLWKL